MAENQSEKMDELFNKLRGLADRAKSTRAQLGAPLVDRALERLTKISAKLPNDGHAQQSQQQPQQPQESTLVCPKCGVLALQGSHFCSSCGFDFSAEARQQLKESFEREKLERNSRIGVITGG